MATDGEEELQTAELLKSWVAPSVNIPMALNGCSRPSGIDELAGETKIEIRTRGVTVRPAEPLTVPTAAPIVVEPCPKLSAKPEPVTVATDNEEEVQTAELLKSWVVPSVNVPMALNCC
jgi:hypothetical protein